MKRGFDFCTTKPLSEKIDFEELEQRYPRAIPPYYKLFFQSFNINPDAANIGIQSSISFEWGTIGLYHDIESWISGSIDIDDEFEERKFIQFASSGLHSGGICVGTLRGEEDVVFVDTEDLDLRFRPIASNVFEFVRGLYI